MNRKVLSIFVFLLYIKTETVLAIAVRKFHDQKDMSEYCRRRVAPSVFLGKQVMEASSYIMHFSQLEVPYSCMLSVRTEPGNNIILVVQLLSEMRLVNACANNGDQLIVYEFGETFGGYWGNLPDSIMRKTTRNYTRFYTQKTTTPTTSSSTTEFKSNTDESHQILMHTVPIATERPKDFIRMEVPLVNVSGNFQLGPPLQDDNAEEMFDFIYDVTPKNGVQYETSVLPLVQFSIKKQKEQGSYDNQRRYDLDYAVDGVTYDSRLLFSTVNKRVTKRRKWPTSTRLNFRKKKIRNKLFTPTSKNYFSKSRSFTNVVARLSGMPLRETKDLIKSFGKATICTTVQVNLSTRSSFDGLFNADYFLCENHVKLHNITDLYLTQKHSLKLSTGHPVMENLLRDKKLDDFKLTVNGRSTLQAYINKSSAININREIEQVMEHALNKVNFSDATTNKLNTVKPDESNKDKISKENFKTTILPQRGTIVDHGSWENIVQAAPVMAVVLKKSETFSEKSQQATKIVRSNKKKRHIHALGIEDSRPRNLTTQRAAATETEFIEYQFSDIQDLAGLVELQDDEITGRLALRYLRNYVGTVLYNICDFNEAKSRQVFLFNASRIVIAVNNFTLEGMTLVLTPAQSLVGSASLCGAGHLECQIIGSRVCIDSMNACDAVPNCGSYDIYDEDRLKCGVTKGLQHTVYLAALTLLAVILTMVYTVHYWLQRCVPKVSDAFFIYTDATENTLLLDSIMRSPNDVDESSSKCAYPGHFFDSDIVYRDGFKDDLNENFCRRIMRRCCALLLCKKKRETRSIDNVNEVYSKTVHSNKFSFTEYELRKFALIRSKEEAVQTGESLEIQTVNYEIRKQEDSIRNIKTDSLIKQEIIDQRDRGKHTEELKLIKITKETRASSQSNAASIEQSLESMSRRHAFVMDDENEREIKSTVYERKSDTKILAKEMRVKCEVHTETPRKNVDSAKRLRFDEELTMIPSIGSCGEITISTLASRRSVVPTARGQGSQDLDMITQVESEVSGSRDFMRFWGTSKGKKGKKKKEKHVPRFH